MPGEKEDDNGFSTAFDTAASSGGQLPSEGNPAPDPEPGTPSADADGGTPNGKAGEAAPPPPPAEGGSGDEKTPAEPAASEPGAEEGSAEKSETPPAAPAAKPKDGKAPDEPVAEPDKPKTLTVEEVLSQLDATLKGSKPEEKPAAQPEARPEPQPEPALYTSEELEVLTEYEKNWPDVSKAQDLKMKAVVHDTIKYVFENVAEFMREPMQKLDAIGNVIHSNEVKAGMPDYSLELEANVNEWIETQPSYLQAAMKGVMQGGTSEEVIDLFRRYQESTGTPAQGQASQGTPPPPAPPAPAKTELSDAAKQAAESLAPVGTERSNVPQGRDPTNFQAAFDEYAEKGVAV